MTLFVRNRVSLPAAVGRIVRRILCFCGVGKEEGQNFHWVASGLHREAGEAL